MKYLKQFEKFSNPFKKKVYSKSDQLIDQLDSTEKEDQEYLNKTFTSFENLGRDEDNNIIGNCKDCGARGVLVTHNNIEPKHKCKK